VAAALVALPAEQLAPVLVAVVEGLATKAAALRYGQRAAESTVPLSKDERGVIEPLAVEWLRQQTATLTPGDALALALLGMIAGRVAVLEADRRQSRPVVTT
jgi:hypothetical protein